VRFALIASIEKLNKTVIDFLFDVRTGVYSIKKPDRKT
jgi:hypothetical protein